VTPAQHGDPVTTDQQSGAVTPARQGDVLLRVRDVRTYFRDRQGIIARLSRRHTGQVQAVDGVSFDVVRGETLGLVGESGSGKSTLARTILGLIPATSGSVTLDGREVLTLRRRQWRPVRRRMQMIFQDPHSSLSPRFRVSFLLNEPYVVHHVPQQERSTVDELLEMVGLSDEQADKYPHELSGGQARRVSIARALALHPDLLLADEPTAGLDVSAAASILNLMKDLARRLGLTYVLITHDLNVVGYCADRIAVMYVGQLVELGPAELILGRPKHPYTHALLSCAPVPDPHLNQGHLDNVLGGEIPSPHDPPSGCRFHPRCAYADGLCEEQVPELEELGGGELVACHHWRHIDFDDAAAVLQPQARSGTT
jgi:oligopeptide/dipeptide ABC transporter ATP-binding protein